MNEIGKMKEQLIADVITLRIKANFATDYCVFVLFHGHVDGLSIEISESAQNFENEIVSKTI